MHKDGGRWRADPRVLQVPCEMQATREIQFIRAAHTRRHAQAMAQGCDVLPAGCAWRLTHLSRLVSGSFFRAVMWRCGRLARYRLDGMES